MLEQNDREILIFWDKVPCIDSQNEEFRQCPYIASPR